MSTKINRRVVESLHITLEAIERFDELIALASKDLPGPVYMSVRTGLETPVDIQLRRPVALEAFRKQRDLLIAHLNTNGFVYDNEHKMQPDREFGRKS